VTPPSSGAVRTDSAAMTARNTATSMYVSSFYTPTIPYLSLSRRHFIIITPELVKIWNIAKSLVLLLISAVNRAAYTVHCQNYYFFSLRVNVVSRCWNTQVWKKGGKHFLHNLEIEDNSFHQFSCIKIVRHRYRRTGFLFTVHFLLFPVFYICCSILAMYIFKISTDMNTKDPRPKPSNFFLKKLYNVLSEIF
jgi:hypothetical protein